MMAFAAWLHATAFSQMIQSVSWIIPLLQSIHLVMIGIVFVSSVVIALHVLGRVRADEPFQAVWGRFAPWSRTALVIMLGTGLLLVAGEPAREFSALSFWLKMALVAVGATGTAAFGRRYGATQAPGANQFPASARLAAVGLIVLWVAVVLLGRAIAYDVEMWGAGVLPWN